MTHGPIEQEQRERMNTLAEYLDLQFNGPREPGFERKIGFALLTYHFGENIAGTGRVNYIGNGHREDVLAALKELIARWEGGQPDTPASP